MTPALALLAGAVVAAWLVPRLLHRMDRRRRDPVPLITTWFVSMAGVLLAAVAAALVLLLPDHGPSGRLLAALHHCWSAVQHGSPPRVEEAAGIVGMTLLAAFACRLLVVSVRGLRWRTRRWQENLAVLRTVARPTSGSADVLWLAHERPLAFSMSGRPGVVVATDGLARHLAPDAVAAVVAHERAHLSGRHHLLVATADALHNALPFVPLFRRAPQAIRELVELAADVAAVRACGPAAVHSALLKVTRHDMPGTALAMAQDAVELRLARLRHGTAPPGGLRRAVSCGLAGMAATTLPFLTAFGILIGIAVLTCPLTG
ncbi:M56 family metallopeptidase [Actinophytocola glycyrrhizae]|uniref:M56 family metallopeptidase n=1 Tax=Actinophytocola glycyrrhizae TaxID=2044873 RepID=A0ABV9RTN9_9PSEU